MPPGLDGKRNMNHVPGKQKNTEKSMALMDSKVKMEAAKIQQLNGANTTKNKNQTAKHNLANLSTPLVSSKKSLTKNPLPGVTSMQPMKTREFLKHPGGGNLQTDHIREIIWTVLGHLRGYPVFQKMIITISTLHITRVKEVGKKNLTLKKNG